MTYNPYGPWSPYGPPPPPYAYPQPPVQYPVPTKKEMKSSFKQFLKDVRDWEEFQKSTKKDEKKEDHHHQKSWLKTADWFMILCLINSITIPAYIILGMKIFK